MSTSTATRTNVPAQRRPHRSEAGRAASTGPAPRRDGRAPVRLTRRGRVVVTLLLLGLVLGAFVLLGGQSVATGEAGGPVPTRTVVVGEGDTLWEIAADVSDGGDLRETVHEIEQLNSLPGPVLTVGQQIAVPVG